MHCGRILRKLGHDTIENTNIRLRSKSVRPSVPRGTEGRTDLELYRSLTSAIRVSPWVS